MRSVVTMKVGIGVAHERCGSLPGEGRMLVVHALDDSRGGVARIINTLADYDKTFTGRMR
jgi:hypothetical protein